MIGAPAGGESRAREGTSTRLAAAGRHALRRLVATIVAFLVCAGIASAGFVSAGLLAATFEAAPSAGATVDRGDVSDPSQHWDEGVAQPVVELKAVEADGDEKDPACEGPEPGPSFRCVLVPRSPARPVLGEVVRDPSCFAAGTGLPRGPPV